MKRIGFFASLLVLLIVIPLLTIQAQDDTTVPDNAQVVFSHQVRSGTLIDNGDGSATLSLTGIQSQYIAVIPGFGTGLLPTNQWAAAWATLTEPIGFPTVDLVTGENVRVTLTLASPAYDEETDTLTYVASVGSVTDLTTGEEVKDGAPTSFENAAVFIQLDAVQITALLDGLLVTRGRCAKRSVEGDSSMRSFLSALLQTTSTPIVPRSTLMARATQGLYTPPPAPTPMPTYIVIGAPAC